MAFQLLISGKAKKSLNNLPESLRLRVWQTLRDIRDYPFSGKKLSGKKKGQYSARVWPYRIIYRIEKKELVIIVIDIDHRQGAYKK